MASRDGGGGRRSSTHRRLALGATGIALLLCLSARIAGAQRTSTATASGSETQRGLAPIPYPPDSMRADQQAFEGLPAAVREILDVRGQIAATDGAPGLTCIPLSTTSDGSRRQRVQGRINGLGLVVFARAARDGTLARVEFVRRLPSGAQRGYTWDSQGDQTTAMDWPPESTQAESSPVPRGGPIPRAVRALGRIVLTWRCTGS